MKSLAVNFLLFFLGFMWYGFLFIACIPYVVLKLVEMAGLEFDSDLQAQLKNQNQL